MGIEGLHGALKPYLKQSHVSELRGLRVGVDASGWLHRGAVGSAVDLATGNRSWVERGFDAPWVNFCMKQVTLMQAAGVTPVLVFDGGRLPAKAATNQQRRQRREEAKQRAQKMIQEGREQEAQGVLMQSVTVTAEMAQELIVKLREQRVEFVVAPYEADAQLAYLASTPEWQGGVTAVVTEDSDLVGYGCRRVLFKMDSAGHCLELSLDRLFAGPQAAGVEAGAAGSSGGKGGSVLSLKGWTLDMLQAACVLAGCDFLPSLKGISFRTAAGFVARRRSLGGALKAIRQEKRFQLLATQEYCAAAEKALLAFKHALVFCPNTEGGCCRRLTLVPEGELAEADLAHLGAELAADVARGLAYGLLHPHTLEPYPAPTAPQSHQQQQRHGQQQQQQQPSIASRRQLGSWVVAGAARSAQQQAGLGPHKPAQLLPPHMLAQVQRQWEGMPSLQAQQQQQQQGGTDVSDVVRHCQPPPQPPLQQQQRQGAGPGAQRASFSPFARARQQQRPHGSSGGSPEAAAAAAGRQSAEQQQQQQQQQQQPSACGSLQEADTVLPASLASSGGGDQQARQAMTPITNQLQQLATQGSTACTSGASQAAASQAPPLWDRGEQYRYVPLPQQPRQQLQQQQQQAVRGTPPAALGSKRKSAGSGGGSSKKAAKLLAPPSQRISRFFVPQSKRQQH